MSGNQKKVYCLLQYTGKFLAYHPEPSLVLFSPEQGRQMISIRAVNKRREL